MRKLILIAVAACSSSASQPQPVEPAPITEPRQPPPLGVPPVVDAKPDAPSGDKRELELAAKVTPFVDAFTSNAPALSPDAKRVAFISNRDGLPQLYIADAAKPAAPAARLVTSTERVGGPFITRDGKAVLFSSDRGADEHWSIFRVNVDGSGLVELTPGERIMRDGFIVPPQQPGTMYFSGRQKSEPKSTLYSASTTTPGPAKAIYADELPAFLTDVSPDGKTALVEQYPSRDENYIVAVDVASGKAVRVYPSEGKVSIQQAVFSPDGKRIYVATDQGAEANVVVAIDVKSKQVVAKHEIKPPTAETIALAASKTGVVAVSLAVGSYSEIRLLDGKTLKQKTAVKMPLGQGQHTSWSADGKQLAAQWSTPSMPLSIYAVDVAGKVTALREDPRPTGVPEIEASVVEIPAFDGGRIPTNVYVAKGEAGKPHPTLVIYHGGPSGVSQIRWSAAIGFFVSLGYAIVEPNVRGSSGYGRAYEAADNGPKRLDAFKDIETSARWVANQPFADKDRLVVYGGSYGGYTTLIALSRWPDIWRAGVNLFGVVNLKTFMATTSGLIRKIFLVEFGDPEKDAEFLAQISPLTDVEKIVDPTFTYAGANDPRVPRTESDLIVKALRQRKVPSEYMVADNEGHSLARRENQIAFYARCARFLESALR